MNKAAINTDILIIGGGLAGLSLAALLGGAGIKTYLVDPQPSPPLSATSPSGRTVALMQSSINIITAAGIWDKIAPNATAMQTMRIIDDSIAAQDRIEVSFNADDIGLPQFGYNIPNAMLRAALCDRLKTLKSVTCKIPGSLTHYKTEQSRIIATLDDGTTINAKLIVGADGKKSKVREIAGIKMTGQSYDQSAVTCIIDHSHPHHNTSTEFHRPNGPLALVPMQGKQSSIVWVDSTARAEQLIRLKKEEFTKILQDETQNILGTITLASTPDHWPLSSLKASALTAPRMALIAETAHVMSPITAQGLNLSLRDVAALAEIIADSMRLGLDIGAASVLSQYEKRRRIDINTRVFGIDRLNKIVSTNAAPLKDLRRIGLRAVDKIAPLRSFAMQQGLAPYNEEGRLARGDTL